MLNNSWGCPDVEGCDPTVFLPAVKALRAAGIFVVGSAGNDGYGGCETVADPLAIYDEVFSVGASNEFGGVADFSSRGPVVVDGSGRVKPDIMAPGEGILSAYPNNSYEIASGTSMAGPHIVGVVALLWSADPSLIGDIEQTEQLIISTATPFAMTDACGNGSTTPSNTTGYGLVNAYEAVVEFSGRALNL
ncbi:MAG: S8 family serine peptidase [Chloroflexi bacterium]|nr:S8 family serine peptidase [Chloroflexota bacterium]